MKDRYLAILDALDRLDGEASTPEIRKETGIDNQDINNALRTLCPEYVVHQGYLYSGDLGGRFGGNPKILRLTDAGAKMAVEYDSPVSSDRFHELNDDVAANREYIQRVESQIEDLRRQTTRLKKLVVALDEDRSF